MAKRNNKNKKAGGRGKSGNNKSTRQQRGASKINSTMAIETVSNIVEILMPWELSQQEKYRTYKIMKEDESVSAALGARTTAIENSIGGSTFECNPHSERSVYLKKYLEYCIHKLPFDLSRLGKDASSGLENGVALAEIVANVETQYDQFRDLFVLSDLSRIDPLTLNTVKPFKTTEGGRKITHWVQDANAFKDTDGLLEVTDIKYGTQIPIDARKVARCTFGTTTSNPLGESELNSAYKDFREKELLTQYLLMGVQKDLAGTPVLRIPADVFYKAEQDPNSKEAATVNQLKVHMTNLSAGDQTFVMLPSDTFNSAGSGASQFDINFKGVDGSDKMFDLVAIIEQKRKSIFTTLGSAHLITGESGGSSYNLHEGKANSSAYLAKRDCCIIENMVNKQIVPYLFKLNEWDNEEVSDIPRFVSGNAQPLSTDEVTKGLQRLSSTGMIPLTPDVINFGLQSLGCHYKVDEKSTTEELREMMTKFETKSGEGEGSSGTGSTQEGGVASDNNSENAA